MHKYPSGAGTMSRGNRAGGHREIRLSLYPLFSVTNDLWVRGAGRNLEIDATVVIGFLRGREIQVGEQNFSSTACREVKERISHDGVVDHVGVVAVFEDEHGRGLSGDGLFWLTRSWFGEN